MDRPENQQRAFSAWRERLGPDGAIDDPAVLARYARSTHPNATRPWCVLLPASTAEVQAIVATAAKEGAGLYPIARGRNWGYGDACAPECGAAILDLSRMDAILEINAELGYAVIEPGVTQQQLYEAVRENAPDFWVDCTGAGKEASIAGNILERGFGHTPYGDHVRTSCGMEVVLADGRLLRTGFLHYPNAKAAWVYPYGTGPMLDGLFSQSNLGVVTRLGVWLYPAPEAFRFFFLRVQDPAALPALIEALRPLRMKGLLNSAVHIGNDLRLLSSLAPYPWEEAKGETPLSETLRARLRREAGIGAWNMSGSLTGTNAQVRAAYRALRRATKPFGKLRFATDARLAWARRIAQFGRRFGLARRLQAQLDTLAPNYGLLKGVPTDEPLRGARWRVRAMDGNDTAQDPRDAGAGLIWMSPVMPLRGEDIQAALDCAAPHFKTHGFDLLATYTLINERAVIAIFNIAFDNNIPEESEAALACYQATLAALKEAGYPPYRTNALGMDAIRDPGDTFWEVTQLLKRALDPKEVLARGRYIPPLDDAPLSG